MEFKSSSRNSMKTVNFIRLASEKGLTIVARNHGQAKLIKEIANEMNINISEPIVMKEKKQNISIYLDEDGEVIRSGLST